MEGLRHVCLPRQGCGWRRRWVGVQAATLRTAPQRPSAPAPHPSTAPEHAPKSSASNGLSWPRLSAWNLLNLPTTTTTLRCRVLSVKAAAGRADTERGLWVHRSAPQAPPRLPHPRLASARSAAVVTRDQHRDQHPREWTPPRPRAQLSPWHAVMQSRCSRPSHWCYSCR